MLEINLLSGVAQRASVPKRAASGGGMPGGVSGPVAAVVGAGLALALWIGFTFWSTGARAAELEEELQKAAADSTTLAATIGRGDLLRARQDTIQQRLNVIASVDGRRYVWPHILDEVSRAVPAFTWLTKLTSAEVAAPVAVAPADPAAAPAAPADAPLPSFSIEGAAANTQALTRFMRNLEMSPYIAGVTLVTSAQQAVGGRAVQQFTVEASYEHPDSALVRTVPVITAP